MKGIGAIIWAAMIADVGILFVLGLLVAPQDSVIGPKIAHLIVLVMIAFSVFNLILASASRNLFAQLGVLNSIAFYGFLLALLGYSWKVYALFYLAALTGMVLKRPVERAIG